LEADTGEKASFTSKLGTALLILWFLEGDSQCGKKHFDQRPQRGLEITFKP